MKQKVILDTDIGDDIDDALALGLILASDELELLGVTTVFSNTSARARQARTILQLAEQPHIPVAAGCGAVMSPRIGTPMDPRQAYLEDVLPNQDSSSLPENQLPPMDPRHAVDMIIETILAGNGDITPITIGAMTNLAMALVKEPRIIERIPRIVSMAAAFGFPVSEWNILCDPIAASIVMRSGIPMRIIGLDVTMRVRFRPEHLEALANSARPLAAKLSQAVRLWQQYMGGTDEEPALPVMHDPLAVATLIQPDLVCWHRGTAHVELVGERTYGFTTFVPDTNGPHEYAYEVDSEAVLTLWMDRILGY